MIAVYNKSTLHKHISTDSELTEPYFLLVDKEQDWTSFDVVAKLRGILKIKKIGHAGTLDPLATGLLIVGVGRGATKKLEHYQGMKKKYIAQIKLGATTKTNDADAEEENIKNDSELQHITTNVIEEVLGGFQGEIEQIPPMYSAKKIKGQRLYKLARRGIELKLEPVQITIYNLSIIKFDSPYLELEVECSKGTYVRSLARDIGEKLKVGAYLSGLRRTAIGEYEVENAMKLNELQDMV